MPADPDRVQAVFLAAAGEPDEAARAAHLDRACGGDAALRARVEALLRAHDPDGTFLDTPAGVVPDPDPAGTRTFAVTPDPDTTRTGASGSADDDDGALTFLAPSARPDALGRIGHYEVLQVLGRGGFGIVLRAFDDVLQRVVAVKVLAPQLAATSPARKRFLREARTSAGVRHENVVQVYEVGETPLPYIAMEFIPGETLQQRLGRVGPVDPAEVVRVGRQIAEGLAAAHANDLIHRDIKPGNILLEGGAQKVKITDFGLARAADDASLSQSGIIAGTPMYMAPEQALGHKLDQRADLFSLGSVLYQMAAGRPPFRANSTVAVLKRVAEDTPRDIREVIPETPQWLCDIIAKLHAKNPDDRFQSAREVADVLADCEAQLKANAKLKDFSRIPRRKPQPSGKRKWVAAAAMLLLPVIVLAVTEITGVTHLLRKNQPTVAVTPEGDPKAEPKAPLATGRFSLAFDGKESMVRIPSLKLNDDHALTVETWTVLEDPVDRRKNYDLVCNTQVAGFALGVPPAKYGGDGRKLGFLMRLTNPNDYVKAWENQPVPRNQLIHLAGVYDGKAEIRFYVNGRLQNRTPAQNVKPSAVPLTFGGNWHGSEQGSRFLGRLYEVRVSRVARYDTDFPPAQRWKPDPDTLALYHFDEGEGTVLTDSSGNGHHGEIVGAKWVEADVSPQPPTYKNTLGMEFVIVPKGKSWLGGGKDKLGDKEVEIPADFYLGKYEVTQEEWEKVMGENPSHFSRTGGGKDAVKNIRDADLNRFPVEKVSWDQCQVFLAKLNEREKDTGWVYRLPKAMEWEYACRGGPMADNAESAFDFYFTKPTNTLLPDQANFDKGLNRTCKVGSFRPNRLGLFDMHGNIVEWCDDTIASQKRIRGGCWPDQADRCRASVNIWQFAPSDKNWLVGLRLARVPSGVPATDRFALAFDGEKSVVRIPSLKIVEDHAFTAEAWAVLEQTAVSNNKNEDLLGNAASSGFVLSVPYRGGGKTAFSIRLKNPDQYFLAFEKQGGPRHQLIHFAGVYDGKTEVRYYVNGQLQSRTPALRVKASDKPLVLGNNQTGTAGFLGRMNGVRISKVARYDSDFTPAKRWEPDTNTLALYHFDEGEGTILKDSSGNGHHGEIVGAKWVKADGSPIPTPSPEAKTPPLAANVLNGAALLMNFEKDTFYEKEGKTYVRDLSGNGNDGVCEDVAFTPDGKAGGGLACKGGQLRFNKSLIIRQPNYTIAVWGRADKFGANVLKERLYATARSELLDEIVFKISIPPSRSVHVNAFNRAKPDKWVVANTKANVISAAEWYFLAVTLSGGGVEQGELRVTVNDTVIRLSSQMVDSSLDGLVDMLGRAMTDCVLDEVAVFQRALSDQEIADVRALGLKGASLGSSKTSPVFAPFTDADAKRIAALPATEQVEEVRKELVKRNPGFDGTVGHKIEGDVVTEIRFLTDQVTDIAPVRVFNALRTLDLSGTHTNYVGSGQLADLSPLAGMNLAGLTRLNLSFTMVGDAGLVHFNGCTNLTYLSLDSTQVSDAGLAYFKNCTNLSHLILGRTKVNAAGVAHFKNCKKLTLLDLSKVSVGDAELGYFAECEQLTRLGLGRTLVTDAGLAPFQNCKKLQYVNLFGTKVGNAGLAYLKDCKQVTGLFIGSTKVTDLSLIKDLPLKELDFDFHPERDAEILRSIKTLEKINGKPAAEFWKGVEQE